MISTWQGLPQSVFVILDAIVSIPNHTAYSKRLIHSKDPMSLNDLVQKTRKVISGPSYKVQRYRWLLISQLNISYADLVLEAPKAICLQIHFIAIYDALDLILRVPFHTRIYLPT